MSLLSAADLASMRSVLDLSLPDTAIVKSQSGTLGDDAGGGGTLTWAASGTFDARIAPISGNEREIADRLVEAAEWVITFPANTPVTANDRVAIGSRTFNVLHSRRPRSWELSRRVEAAEVR